MHDPLVVAFEIRRPWPTHLWRGLPMQPRWQWRPWSPYVHLAGREYYFPALVTVWHHEPDDRDAFEVCKHRTHWRWHVHHWQLQVPALQALRRRLLTYCAWCGGRDAPGDRVNCSAGWDGERGPWWQGQRMLFHADCLDMPRAQRSCTCALPVFAHPMNTWGPCQQCNRFRAAGLTDAQLDRLRLLQQVPFGTRPSRIPALREDTRA